MTVSLNPLSKVIEHPQYPMARIYRTSFWTGICDTYDVLVGNHYGDNGSRRRMGVLDLLIFPLISIWLAERFPNPYNRLIHVALLIIAWPIELLRHLLGGLLTLPLIPIVAIVHACAYSFKKKELKTNLCRLKIEKVKPLRQRPPPGLVNLLTEDGMLPFSFLSEPRNIQLVDKAQEDAESELESESKSESSAAAAVEEHKEDASVDACYLAIDYYPVYQRRFLANMSERNVKAIGTLLETNTANILNTLNREDLQKLQQYLKKPPERVIREIFCNGSSKSARNQSPLADLFRNEYFHAKPTLSLIFDMAGIANEEQEKISRNPKTSVKKNLH